MKYPAHQQALSSDYWYEKIKAFPHYKITKDNGDKTYVYSAVVDKSTLVYFYKATGENEEARLVIYQSIFAILLKKYFPDTSAVIVSPPVQRNQENQHGLFFHANFSNTDSVREIIRMGREEYLEAMNHAFYDYDRLSAELFKENIDISNYLRFGLLYNRLHSDTNVLHQCNWQLFISEHPVSGNTVLELKINAGHEEALLGEQFLEHFGGVLHNLAVHLDVEFGKIDLLSEEEKQKILLDFNNTSAPDLLQHTIVDRWKTSVKKNPANTALIYEDHQYDYESLNKAANRMANYLITEFAVTNDSIIGIMMLKNPDAIISILGVLKAGAAYLPIDISYPAERINYILRDSGISLLISSDAIKTREMCDGKNITIVDPAKLEACLLSEEEPAIQLSPNDLAYLIYTSGSTGLPKGVMVEHGSIVNMSLDQIRTFSVCESDKVLLFASLSFDASVSEIFMALYSGAALVIPTTDIIKDQENILSYMKAKEVTVVTFPPSYLAKLALPELTFLKCIITAGEPASVLTAATISAYTNYFNAYGPTECAVCVSTYQVNPAEKSRLSIPIGKPIANLKVFILNEHLQPVPIGLKGYIYVAGAGLARGYLNKIDLTAEKFVENPFSPGEKMYKTGDIGSWLQSGDIEFWGRTDDQVKIRGFRIELGEIEWHLVQFSNAIEFVIVDVKEVNGEKVLIAYYTARQEINIEDLKAHLQSMLPEYMVPAFYKQINAFPITPNGKVDKKALSASLEELINRKEYVAPGTETEIAVEKIWANVLLVNRIGVHDNFFDLGGHSLLIGQVINRIHQALGKSVSFRDFFANPTIAAISSLLRADTFTSIPGAPLLKAYPVTASQKRLWILSQLADASIAYNMPGVVRFKGKVKIETLQAAFRYLISRHEILRTYFDVNSKGELQQFIRSEDDISFEISFRDFKNTVSQKQAIEHYLQESNHLPFDLKNDLLIRASLMQQETDDHLFFLSMPHIISDGWSVEILISEVMMVYNALLLNQEVTLPLLKLQYKDYACWLAGEQHSEKYELAAQFWQQLFANTIPPVLDLPAFKKRAVHKTYSGDTIGYHFPDTFLNQLRTFSREQESTLFMTLMAGIRTLLHLYTNQNDITLGTPVAGREHSELEGQVGLYLNTLPIRAQIDRRDAFQDILQKEKQLLLNAFEHQHYPFDELVEKIGHKRDLSRSALFDVLVVLQSQEQLKNLRSNAAMIGVQISDHTFCRKTSQFDLSFVFTEGDGLKLNIEFNTDIYDTILIDHMFGHLRNLLGKVMEQPELPAEKIDFLTEEETVEIEEVFNATTVVYEREQTIIDLFEDRVKLSPDNTAVVFQRNTLSYRKLNEVANRFANYINEVKKIKKGSFIGINISRSEFLICTLMGILKSGNAYVMIDPSFPPDRIAYMLADADCALLVDDGVIDDFKTIMGELSADDLQIKPSLNDKVYLMYTSGSTGKPKGAVNILKGFTNTVKWYAEDIGISENDRVGIVSNVSFDLTQKNYFAPLICGAAIYIDNLDGPVCTLKFLHVNEISIINCAPVLFYSIVESDLSALGSLKKVILGGEGIKLNQIEAFMHANKGARIYNSYGPSEASDVSSFYQLNGRETNVPVGKPIRNTKLIILTDQLNLCPIGVIGEICVSGIGVSLGYLNNTTLTNEKFIDTEKFGRIYKTGDLGRWMPDGNVEFLNRKDFQVKIRGNRVEPEEVEIALATCTAQIKQVVVEPKDFNKEKVLAAYYIADQEIDKTWLRKQLGSKLPEYMIPDFYIKVDVFPLTPNGKINRKSLPDVTTNDLVRREYMPPCNVVEEKLVSIWQTVLGIDRISILDDFFEIGGSSLKIMSIINLVKAELGVVLQFRDVFSNPTPALLAASIDAKRTHRDRDAHLVEVLEEKPYYDITPAQFGLWFECQLGDESALAYNMINGCMIAGVPDPVIMKRSVRILSDRYEILRTAFMMNEIGVVQVVSPIGEKEPDMEIKYLSLDPEQIATTANNTLRNERLHLFDLEAVPLFRIRYLVINEEKSILILNIHHIICDGISLKILIKELFNIYRQLAGNGDYDFSPPIIQFKEYAHWINNLITCNEEKYKSYWRQQLLPLPAKLMLGKYEAESGNTGRIFSSKLDSTIAGRIRQFVQHNNVTEYMLYAALLSSVLNEWTSNDEIIILSPWAIRPHTMFEDQIGLFLNTVPLKVKVANKVFPDLLRSVKETVLSNWDHSAYPFAHIMDLLKETAAVDEGLFNVMMTLQNQGFNEEDFPYPITEIDDKAAERNAMVDLLFNIIPNGSEIIINAEYKTSNLSEDQMKQFMNRFVELIGIHVK